ncbi:hypothetical protein ACFLXE_05240 [Chloroflexota bacterium]
MSNEDSNKNAARCLICNGPLSIQLARGRKSGKPFVMLICQQDGRHFRAFVNHQPYVRQVLDHLEDCK